MSKRAYRIFRPLRVPMNRRSCSSRSVLAAPAASGRCGTIQAHPARRRRPPGRVPPRHPVKHPAASRPFDGRHLESLLLVRVCWPRSLTGEMTRGTCLRRDKCPAREIFWSCDAAGRLTRRAPDRCRLAARFRSGWRADDGGGGAMSGSTRSARSRTGSVWPRPCRRRCRGRANEGKCHCATY